MENKFTVKDLVTIGVFSVIYFMGMYLLGWMGVIPILFLIWPAITGLVMGVVVMLFMAKVQKPWALFILGILPSLIMFAMGHTYVIFIHGILIMLVAEFLRRKNHFRSFPATALAYGVFSMWACGSLLQILVVKESFISMTIKTMGNEYAMQVDKLITIPSMILVYFGAFIGGILGALLGKAMLKKHFEKARIV